MGTGEKQGGGCVCVWERVITFVYTVVFITCFISLEI